MSFDDPLPDPGYHVVNWSDGSTHNARTDVNATNDHDVTANFALCRVRGLSMLTNKLTVTFEGTAGFANDVERSTNLTPWTGGPADRRGYEYHRPVRRSDRLC